MRLVSLTVQGYRQFQDETVIPFPPRGLIGIVGPNGSGKSKLVEAIGYALFGSRGPHITEDEHADDILSYGLPSTARVRAELRFDIDGQQYCVVRDRRGVRLYEEGSDDPQVIGSRDVVKVIQRRLNLRPATYVGTFVAKQRDVVGLLRKGPTERMRLVNELIGVAQVELALDLMADELRSLEKTATDARRKADTIVITAKANLAEKRRELSASNRKFRRASQRCERRRAHAKEAESELRDLERKVAEANGLTRQAATVEAVLDTTRSQIRSREAEVKEIQKDEAAMKVVGAHAGDLLAAQDEVAILEALAGLQTSRLNRARIVQRLGGHLAREIARLDRARRGEAQLELRLKVLDSAIQDSMTQRTTLQAQANAAESQAGGVAKRLEVVESMGRDGPCDRCGGKLGRRYERVSRLLSRELRDARGSAAALAAKVTRLDDRLRAQSAVRQILETRRLACRHVVRDELRSVEGDVKAAELQRDEIDRDIAVLTSRLPADRRARRYSRREHARASARLDRANVADRQMIAIRERVGRRDQVDQALGGLLDDARRLTANLADLKRQAMQLRPAPSVVTRVKERHNDLQRHVLRLEAELEQVRNARADCEAAVKLASTQLLDAQRFSLEAASAARSHLIAVRARDHLRALLREFAEDAQPRLTAYMNTWMGPLFDDRFESIHLTEDFGLRANNGGGQRPITHFSDGEQTILGVLLRAAIALFCRDRSGFSSGFLVLDEVFGNQDFHRRHQLVQFLEELRPSFEQIFVVNHIQDIDSYFDAILDVIPVTRNTSRVEVR